MKLKHISWLPVAIVMVMIFCFSSKPAIDSNEGSMTIAKGLFNIYENVTDRHIDEVKRIDMVENINYIVRKSSHFCEYALLSFLIALHLLVLKKKRRYLFVLPIVISALYAATDEFHQTWVPGRGGQFRDVLLDTSGAAMGALCFVILISIISYHNRKRQGVIEQQL